MYVSSDILSRRLQRRNAVFGPDNAKQATFPDLKRCSEQGLYNKSLELSPKVVVWFEGNVVPRRSLRAGDSAAQLNSMFDRPGLGGRVGISGTGIITSAVELVEGRTSDR